MKTISFFKVIFIALVMTTGCGDKDTVAEVTDEDSDVTESRTTTADTSGATDSEEIGAAGLPGSAGSTFSNENPLTISREQFCAGTGTVVNIEQNGIRADVCTGRIAERLFRFALCSCTNVSGVGGLITDSFNSGSGSYQSGQAGGAVGTNGNLIAAGTTRIGGTLISAGAAPMSFVANQEIQGDFQTNADLTFAGSLHVYRDAWVRGQVQGVGSAVVERDLHYGKDVFVINAFGMTIGGQKIQEDFTVSEPCPCNSEHLLDVPAIVEQVKQNNDNAEARLDPDALSPVLTVQTIELPCGRFFLESVSIVGHVTLKIEQRTALFVGGDFTVGGSFYVDVGPEGELDLFIGGNLRTVGSTSFGDKNRPAASRIYVGGRSGLGDITLAGLNDFVGNLYAPTASVRTVGLLNIYGAVFGREFISGGTTFIHYDRSILDVGNDCEDTPLTDETCVSAGDSCDRDSDCCEPLVCDNGICSSLLPIIL